MNFPSSLTVLSLSSRKPGIFFIKGFILITFGPNCLKNKKKWIISYTELIFFICY